MGALPPAARARGHEGNRRLNQRWQTFTARRKKPVVANVAIARELAGWAWSLAVLEEHHRVDLVARHRSGRSARDDPRDSSGQPTSITETATSAPRPAEASQPNTDLR